MRTETLTIEGMSCGHCVMAVKKELEKLNGVKIESVEIGSAKIEYDENTVSKETIKNAIDEAGYKLV